jgi:SNF2 family DNA or RNA helicase
MSKSWKVSLTRLKTPYTHIKGISRANNLTQLPASPSLLKSLNIHAPKYYQDRNELLARKNVDIIIDKRLRPYQNQDVYFLMGLKNKLVLNEQRTGKTPTTLVCMRELHENSNIIIAPGSTLYSWKEEFEKWHGGQAVVYAGTKKQRGKIIDNLYGQTLIMTYGIVRNDKDILMKLNYDAIVVDEVHRLRNFRGMRSKKSPAMSKAIIQVSRKAKTKYALTGTPAPNMPDNIFGMLHLIMSKLFTSFWQFAEYFFTVDEKIINADLDTKKDIGGYINKQKEKEAQEFFELISVQRKRKEVMKWLPKIDISTITIPLKSKQEKQIKQMHELYETEGLEALNDLDKLTKERQLVLDPRIVGLGGVGAKTEWLKQYIEDYPEKHLLIVSMSTKYLKLLHDELDNTTLLIGGLTDKQKYKIESEFNNEKHKILLCNLDVIKEGMKLYRTDTMIFVNQSFVYTDNEQAQARLIPINEQIAKEMQNQKIIILNGDCDVDKYTASMLKYKKSKSEIINNYRGV